MRYFARVSCPEPSISAWASIGLFCGVQGLLSATESMSACLAIRDSATRTQSLR